MRAPIVEVLEKAMQRKMTMVIKPNLFKFNEGDMDGEVGSDGEDASQEDEDRQY